LITVLPIGATRAWIPRLQGSQGPSLCKPPPVRKLAVDLRRHRGETDRTVQWVFPDTSLGCLYGQLIGRMPANDCNVEPWQWWRIPERGNACSCVASRSNVRRAIRFRIARAVAPVCNSSEEIRSSHWRRWSGRR
jgi:hypothetical protein